MEGSYLDIPDSCARGRSAMLGKRLHRFEVYLRLKRDRIVELPQLATQTAVATFFLLPQQESPDQ